MKGYRLLKQKELKSGLEVFSIKRGEILYAGRIRHCNLVGANDGLYSSLDIYKKWNGDGRISGREDWHLRHCEDGTVFDAHGCSDGKTKLWVKDKPYKFLLKRRI